MDELKPCPFCGSGAEIVTKDVEPQGDNWYGKRVETFVQCVGCGCCMFDEYFHCGFCDAEDAAKDWNRRVPQQCEAWEKAKETLEFYADSDTYKYPPGDEDLPIFYDEGVKAQEALATIEAAEKNAPTTRKRAWTGPGHLEQTGYIEAAETINQKENAK